MLGYSGFVALALSEISRQASKSTLSLSSDTVNSINVATYSVSFDIINFQYSFRNKFSSKTENYKDFNE